MTEIESAGFKDILIGTELFKTLNLSSHELSAEPAKFAKFKMLATFLNEHPDPMWVISRVRNNRSGQDNLDYLTNYARLNMESANLQQKLSGIQKDLKFYEQ